MVVGQGELGAVVDMGGPGGPLDDQQPDVVMYAQYDNINNATTIDNGLVTNSNRVDTGKDVIPSPSPSPRWPLSSLLSYQPFCCCTCQCHYINLLI